MGRIGHDLLEETLRPRMRTAALNVLIGHPMRPQQASPGHVCAREAATLYTIWPLLDSSNRREQLVSYCNRA